VDDLTTLFGPQARNPIEYREQDWSTEPWQTGCLPRIPQASSAPTTPGSPAR